ncbi:uncharacterized protein A4U43_C01F6410 [Asparagus officinalis]|uniref:FPL domain-containing protein n=1 Tax=Asparagus officinalis TaxID=4686 RepID=A0A5P1FMU7_ASPOF|nr:uncharacterized protein A4U43_C01F6410 [Asparagus officinalis]
MSWLSFWRSRNRFSLDELRYLTDQLQRVHIVNEVNKDFVIEALRSIAELVTYGDQNNPSFFEFFMEKQIMGEFARILRISRTSRVALQLLQTMSIMIQNLRSEHSIYYIFSNEHINYFITYSFDFRNDELLSYYISFLRAISGKLNRQTISLLVQSRNDEILAFPLYTEAIKYAFHDESMVRIAVRALTLNVYHVGDDCVNRYVSRRPLSDYFSKLVEYFTDQCISLDEFSSQASVDVISAGVPDMGKLISDNVLRLLVFPLLLPTLKRQIAGSQISITTCLYLLCCILRIVKTKDLATIIASTLFCYSDIFILKCETRPNGTDSKYGVSQPYRQENPDSVVEEEDSESSGANLSAVHCPSPQRNGYGSNITLREILLSFIINGDESHALGSLTLLSTLLQTKELDESVLDGLGILPQRKQHKKLLLQALVGEGAGEEQLFSPENNVVKDYIDTELERDLQKLKGCYGLSCCCDVSVSPQKHRYQVLDALADLFCRSSLSAETLWTGGWLLRQLLPHGEEEFTTNHLKQLKDAHKYTTAYLNEEIKGSWSDMLLLVLRDEWRNCKRAIEASSPQRDPKSILLPPRTCSSEGDSSFAAGERMCEVVKVFVLQRQLLIFSSGGYIPDQPPLHTPVSSPVHSRAETAGLDVFPPKLGSEINLDEAIPCRIAFERGKERHLSFLAISKGTSGWILLSEEFPLKQRSGIVRVTAPLAGSDPRIDERHPKWLHLRIRPYSLPYLDPLKFTASGKGKAKVLVDGRWTLAFRDEKACKAAESMVIEEMNLLHSQVEERVQSLLNEDPIIPEIASNSSSSPSDSSQTSSG